MRRPGSAVSLALLLLAALPSAGLAGSSTQATLAVGAFVPARCVVTTSVAAGASPASAPVGVRCTRGAATSRAAALEPAPAGSPDTRAPEGPRLSAPSPLIEREPSQLDTAGLPPGTERITINF